MTEGNLQNIDIEKARELLKSIEQGNHAQANSIINDIVSRDESSLFQEVGKLTRELHETLNAFRLDDRIKLMATDDIPDAKERLNYVISMTEQAANTVLNAVEESMPISEALESRSGKLHSEWGRFKKREMSVDEFREFSKELEEFLAWTGTNASLLRSNLSDVLMSQDFQDITGQIIKRVIRLVTEVEGNLVELIRITGNKIGPKGQMNEQTKSEDQKSTLDGPVIPELDLVKENVVAGQDDVDQLLSSLGF